LVKQLLTLSLQQWNRYEQNMIITNQQVKQTKQQMKLPERQMNMTDP
jgi:hypothetical protein